MLITLTEYEIKEALSNAINEKLSDDMPAVETNSTWFNVYDRTDKKIEGETLIEFVTDIRIPE